MSDEKKNTAKTKERSVAYPSVSLGDAIEFTRKLRDALGKGPYSREEAAKALGHTNLTGPAARKVAALVQYGLLERNGNTYSQSERAQDILKPLSDESRDAAIQRAAVSPRLFAKLAGRFGGQALPNLLQNIVVRDGVSEGAAEEVVRIFTDTMKSANLLVNGVLAKIEIVEDEDSSDTVPSSTLPVVSIASARYQATPLPVPTREPNDAFVFDFAGGIRLVIPRTKQTSEAIADGELKDARKALADFALTHMPSDTPADDESGGSTED
jgi:hypothetical protein